MEKIDLIVEDSDDNIRIDKYISNALSELSRAYIQKVIKEENVTVNGKIIKANYKVSKGDVITILINDPEPLDVKPVNIPIDIVFEDQDIIIVNKGKDMVVHPAPGHYEDTLVNAIMYHCGDSLSGINGVNRPGIVHRIDKDTTGLLVICKTDTAHIDISKQLKEHSIKRVYEAIVYHNVKEDKGIIDAPIGRHPIQRKKMAINYKNGKHAVTHYTVVKRLNNNRYTHLSLELETGRTHQIRVHMASIHHPLLGDDIYGPKNSPFNLEGQVLHAKTLGFIHPTTKQYIEFNSELPIYFQNLLNNLK
jgi:23S rRNA pseudouridine1911/1915/1917 synthase